MKSSESISKIAPALLKAQAQMSNPKKGASNPFFNKKYADLNSIREACIPALNENGIAVLQPTIVNDGKNYINTILLHESGEWLSSLTEIIASKPNDAQSHGSGMSYARRYSLQSFCMLGADDDDGNKAVDKDSLTTHIKAIQQCESVDELKEVKAHTPANIQANEQWKQAATLTYKKLTNDGNKQQAK
jgi:hypothetical protein